MPQACETDTTRLDHLHSRKQAQASRKRIEATIENLIALLDTIDGDPDLEDGGEDEDGGDDEPSLGAPECTAKHRVGYVDHHHHYLSSTSQERWASGGTDDRELETEHDEDGADDELSLCGLTVSWPSPNDREPDGDEIDDDNHDERWSQPVFLDGSGCGSRRTF